MAFMRRYIITALAGLTALATLTSIGLITAQAATRPAVPVAVPRAVNLHPVTVKHGRPAITIPRSKKGTINRLGGGNLQYWGGPIQQDPQVYVLFWGSWWSSTCANTQNNGSGDESYLYALYNGLATTSDNLSPITSQYYGPAGTYPIFPTKAGKAFITWNADCTDPPASATDAQLAAEASSYASALASEGYTISNNTQIIVVSPSGTNPGGGFGSSYCAYHNWAQYSSSQLLSWTNLPYIPDQGSNCGANDVQNGYDGWSIVGGHEYAESITDPFVNNQSAWFDNQGYEIGDKCAWTNLFAQTTSTGTFAMQPEWDNRTSACKPVSTYPNGHIALASNTTLCAQGTYSSAVTLYSPCDASYNRIFARYPDGSLRRWKNTARCITPKNGSSTDGTPLVMVPCTNAKNQQWTWSSSTGQWVNGATGKCMRAPTAANGAALVENTCGLTDGTEKFTNV